MGIDDKYASSRTESARRTQGTLRFVRGKGDTARQAVLTPVLSICFPYCAVAETQLDTGGYFPLAGGALDCQGSARLCVNSNSVEGKKTAFGHCYEHSLHMCWGLQPQFCVCGQVHDLAVVVD